MKPEGPSHKFGTAPVEVRNEHSDAPGPGYYNLERNVNKKEGVSFPTAPREGNEGQKEDAPGPGYYNIERKPEGPSYKFGTAPVEEKNPHTDAPGPGYYNVDGNPNKASGGVAFSTAPRDVNELHREDAPGPGYYNLEKKPEGPRTSSEPLLQRSIRSIKTISQALGITMWRTEEETPRVLLPFPPRLVRRTNLITTMMRQAQGIIT
ncbi:hypothetical protein AGDE_16130 [Angomonas deanei]|nr:hypothetical protein AGDE_16130 [Angomonas deanei]|eukprot:EPY17661.1 hypothetical protein AGDE_16130 [Angomonas deanei]